MDSGLIKPLTSELPNNQNDEEALGDEIIIPKQQDPLNDDDGTKEILVHNQSEEESKESNDNSAGERSGNRLEIELSVKAQVSSSQAIRSNPEAGGVQQDDVAQQDVSPRSKNIQNQSKKPKFRKVRLPTHEQLQNLS